MNICFISHALKFDVSTPLKAPLGGTESCVCYLSVALAGLGHAVTLLGNNDDVGLVMGVNCVDIAKHGNTAFFHQQRFDAVVVVNSLDIVPVLTADVLPPGTPVFLWNHHDSNQPAIRSLGDANIRRCLAGIVFVSRYQQETTARYFPLADVPTCAIGNGLTPSFGNLFASADDLLNRKKSSNIAVYTSTPFRGLSALFDVMQDAPQDVTLKVFSSMKVYQSDDRPFEPLFERGRSLRNVQLRGSVSQTQLAQELAQASLFTYPSTFPETFCIAALEALAAGLDVITTDLGALPETCGKFATYLPHSLLTSHPEQFIAEFRQAMARNIAFKSSRSAEWALRQFEQASQVSAAFTWANRAREWERALAGDSSTRRP
jgi:glycosyltransferase involved in cell wall biosynthesis